MPHLRKHALSKIERQVIEMDDPPKKKRPSGSSYANPSWYGGSVSWIFSATGQGRATIATTGLACFLLQEDGSRLLLESGDGFLQG